jgi:WD40 repeat protein
MQNYLIYELKDQSNAPITGLIIPNYDEIKANSHRPSAPAQPFLLSCSQDGSLRLWNLDTGHCLYRLETSQECFGVQWMKHDMFYTYSKDRVSLWNLNRYYTTFSFVHSPITHLFRKEMSANGKPARLVSVAADGSIRLLSPVTGTTLATAFPVIRENVMKQVEYDACSGKILECL